MPRKERPLDQGDTPLLSFAADLRKLREKAGNPVYRELSRRAHYSVPSLSEAAGGRKLPSLAVTMAYVRACGGDENEWEARWRQVSEELGAFAEPGETTCRDHTRAPYVGLATFEPDDADRFHGREKLVEELRARVAGRRLVAVVGTSGSGKSSLLRAGLIPGLAGGPLVLMTPGDHPIEECAARLSALGAGGIIAVREALRTLPNALHLLSLQVLAGAAETTELLVVIDQFEEVFTLCHDPEERTKLLSILHEAATAQNSRIRIVLGVRADFYGHCTRCPDLSEVLRSGQVVVTPMTTEELRAAITLPAEGLGLQLETALLSRVVADATGQPGVLPLVSHAMLETWRRRRDTTLTLSGYEAAGGIAQAVARTAQDTYDKLSADQQQWARALFIRLVAFGDGTEDTRRRVGRAELDLDGTDGMAVLEQLSRARLVTLDHDAVQMTHEALIRCWPLLRQWLAEDRERLHLCRQLTEAAQSWESLGRDSGALYRGARLESARLLDRAALNCHERTFLEASVAADAAERAAARRRVLGMRSLVALLAVLLVLTTTAMGYAVRTKAEIAEQRDSALSQRVSDEAVALQGTDPALAAQLALAAYRLVTSSNTRDGLLSTMSTTLPGHTQTVSSVAFSPDGHTIATGGYDRTVRLWQLETPWHPVEFGSFTAHSDIVVAVAFSPDGHTLATASRDRTIRLWNITDPRSPQLLSTLTGHSDIVFSVTFSPDGRTLASGSYDHTIRLWNVADVRQPEALSVLTGHALNVKPVAFSPDGHTLASGSDDHTVRLWDVSDPRNPSELVVLRGHTDFVDAVAFSADGHTLASGSDDHTVRLWDVTDRRQPVPLATITGFSDVVSAVAFSPKANILATTSTDHTARLYDMTDNRHPVLSATFSGHLGAINAVAFAPDGSTVATVSNDHTARLWGTDLHDAETRACQAAHPSITNDLWQQYFPGLAYQPPCPG